MSKILGLYSKSYPSELTNFCKIIIVLVEGEINDYAAYAGVGRPEWVALNGDKLSFEEASQYFFNLRKERYRL